MKRLLLSILFVTLSSVAVARAQTPQAGGEIVDRMVAVVNGKELITYSDLLWQLALQPNVPLENPRQEDLRRALDLLTDQRLILEEAEKLPSAAPTEQEIADEEKRVIGFFPSMSAFYERLSRVGRLFRCGRSRGGGKRRRVLRERGDQRVLTAHRLRELLISVVLLLQWEHLQRGLPLVRRARFSL